MSFAIKPSTTISKNIIPIVHWNNLVEDTNIYLCGQRHFYREGGAMSNLSILPS